MRKNDTGDLLVALPGIVIDTQGDLRYVVKSDVAIGVTIQCFDTLCPLDKFALILTKESWVVVFRHCPDEVFLLRPIMNIQPMPEQASPRENEAGQFAIELGLSAWPHWSPQYESRFTPRPFLPFTTGLQSAIEN